MPPWPMRQEIFDTFWKFAHYRQEVFFARLEGKPAPWIDDEAGDGIGAALNKYKFTNCYRAADRVSQYLIRNVIYKHSQEPAEVVFRILFFKIFNLPSIWEWILETDALPEHCMFEVEYYGRLLDEAKAAGQTLFNNAYMLTGSKFHGYDVKHWNYLQTLHDIVVRDNGAERIANAETMQEVFEFLLGYPGIAEFLAYQFAIDINYSRVTDFDENSFTYPGGGAVRGIMKCFAFEHTPAVSVMQEIILWMAEHQQEQFDRLGLPFRSLWGRPLSSLDSQSVFCECDKISRVLFPDTEMQGKQRIKENYDTSKPGKPIVYRFPPKWRINSMIKESMG